MNYSSVKKWKIWTSIILVCLSGIVGLMSPIKSFISNQPFLTSLVSLIITLAVIYFVTYIPIKIMYEEVK